MRTLLVLLVLAVMSASLFAETKGATIASGSKIYIEAKDGNEGFDTYLRAAFDKKKVPLAIVVDKDKADLVLVNTVISGKEPGAAAIIFTGKRNANQDASASIVDIKSGVVLYSYSVHKYNAVNGKQSAAEAIAKHIKDKIESGK